MKKHITLIIMLAVAALLALCLLPAFMTRVKNEAQNDNVTVSLLYNDIKNKVSDSYLDSYLMRCAEAGIKTVSFSEETLNALISRGDITCIKYHDIRHKYDDETTAIEDELEKLDKINYDSYVIILKRPEMKEFFAHWMPLRYTDEDYTCVGDIEGRTVYVFYDGTISSSQIYIGYNEAAIAELYERQFGIALTLHVGSYGSTGYLNELERMIGAYGVKYLNLSDVKRSHETDDEAEANYSVLEKLIPNLGLTLVVTEEADQLSNVKCIGYNKIFNNCTNRVMRSYETYDCYNIDETGWMFRYYQYLNSLVDRNIRFVTMTQIADNNYSYEMAAELSLTAATKFIERAGELGYDTAVNDIYYNYNGSRTLNLALSAAIMALLGMSLLYIVFNIKWRYYLPLSLALAVCSILGTFVLPDFILLLYPTAMAVILPCFAVTVFLAFVRAYREKLNTLLLTVSSCGVMLGVMAAGCYVMSVMVSGISYYINNDIFRGIKLSLFAPILFAAAAYYFMFIYRRGSVISDLRSALTANIKIYWALFALVLAAIAAVYIIRSGNVNTISSIEAMMRRFITEKFPARPRTKEFLVAYPCLVLFIYYYKNTNVKLLHWSFAAGASMLAASVMNSFCHVFTGVGTIYMRVINGLLIGIVTGAAVYVVNLIIVKIVSAVTKSDKTV